MILVIIAIGLPGSGKTTRLKPLAEKYGLSYISRDAVYKDMFAVDSDDRSVIGAVWEETNRRLRAEIQKGKSVVRDSVFADHEERIDTIRAVRKWGADRVIGVFVNVDLDVAKAQNRHRERVVRDEVIEWRHAQLYHYPPSLSDGFDALYTHEQLEEFEKGELGGA